MSDVVTRIRVEELSDAAEYHYAASVAPGARLVFLAGACPLDADGATIGPGDVAAQAEQCVANLVVALAAADASLDDVVQTRVLVATARRSELVAAWRAVRSAFGTLDPPSTLHGVTVLGYDGQLVEVEAVAAVR